MQPEWNGNERRQPTKDHDTLIQVVTILDNHVKNFNMHTDAFKAHEIRDQANFDSLRKDVLGIQRVIWIATGIILAVQFLPTALKLMHILNK
jgi:hypothetical protein